MQEERRLIDKVFSIVDKDNSGQVDIEELKGMFRLFNVEASFLESAISRRKISVDSYGSKPFWETSGHLELFSIHFSSILGWVAWDFHVQVGLLGLCHESSVRSQLRIMSNVDKDLDYMISPQEFYTLLSQKFEKDDPKEEA